MGQCEYQGADSQDQHAPAQPSWFVPVAPKVAYEGEAQTGSNVVGAGDEPALVAVQIEAAFDGGDDSIDEAIYRHALKEGGRTQEEEEALGGVEDLQALGCEGLPAAQRVLWP